MPEAERVTLADGAALQCLLPGVAPVAQASRDLAALERARATRRGSAPLPAGGLFDLTQRAQQELFSPP